MSALISFLSFLPVIFTAVFAVSKKLIPLLAWLRSLLLGGWSGAFSTAARSTLFGLFLSVVVFLGGFAFFVLVGFKFSLEKFAFAIDVLLAPFSFLVSSLLNLVLSSAGGCPEMPSAFSVFLGVLHLNIFVGIVVTSICCEVFLRFFIRNLLNRAV